MEITENISLKALNTFGIDAKARYFANCKTVKDIEEILARKELYELPRLVLGGGSNILFTGDFGGTVLKPDLKGIEVTGEDENFVRIRAMAGENWDGFVQFAVDHGLGGVENLSGIPGNVGSCPIQNIGAYGAEARDTIERVEMLNVKDLSRSELHGHQCAFGYRDSIFKRELKSKAIILSVTFQLRKKPVFVTSYGNISEELNHYPEISLRTIREAILAIRKRKLPDPAEIGNAGSFFKNPVIGASRLSALLNDHPQIPHFLQKHGEAKIPAAWLIEQCGWKAVRRGDAGVHKNQPLVLVNYGNATGNEIIALARDIQKSVKEKFGVDIEPEVNLV